MNNMTNNKVLNYKSSIKGLGSFFVIFENSSNVEYSGFYGISHLIEHCMCEKVKQLELEFEKHGISFNACTSSTRVMFYIKGLDEGIIKFRKQFYERIVTYQITKDVFERERSIVIQQYNDQLSDQKYAFIENAYRKYFNTRFPCGQINDLKNLTYEEFINYKNEHFCLPTKICNTSKSKCKNAQFKTEEKNYNFIDETYLHLNGTNLPLVSGPNVDITRIVGYFNSFKYSIDDEGMTKLIYFSLFEKYMCYGLSSPLYQELREKTGKVYQISSYVESLYEAGNGIYGIILSVDPTFVNEIKQKLLDCLNKNINNLNQQVFYDVVTALKNDLKKKHLTLTQNTDSFTEKLEEKLRNFKFDFDDFKEFVKTISKNNYIIINDIQI